jgi:hypothetical protein
MKQTRQAVHAVKQSIFLDVYGLKLKFLKQEEKKINSASGLYYKRITIVIYNRKNSTIVWPILKQLL